jgi:asparaginyl-tRNA synthetase
MTGLEETLEHLDLTGAIYTSELHGSDETGDGTEAKPFKTALKGLRLNDKVLVDAKDPAQKKYELISKTQLKKLKNFIDAEVRKDASKNAKEAEDAARREKNMEEAKKVIIKEDPSLPKSKTVKISEISGATTDRIKVFGWCHRLRRQGKT